MEDDEHQELIEKYKQKIKEEFGDLPAFEKKISSKEYTDFKRELYPTQYSLYEKACNFSEQVLKLKTDSKKTQEALNTSHLNCTPSGVLSFAILAGLIVAILGSFLLFSIPFLLGVQEPMLFLIFFSLVAGILMIPALQRFPFFLANKWRIKASNQMIQSIFYLVTYMRHTSNLERAIE